MPCSWRAPAHNQLLRVALLAAFLFVCSTVLLVLRVSPPLSSAGFPGAPPPVPELAWASELEELPAVGLLSPKTEGVNPPLAPELVPQRGRCRVLQQSPDLLVDDRGVMCSRSDLDASSSCCKLEGTLLPAIPHACQFCKPLHQLTTEQHQHRSRHGNLPVDDQLRHPGVDESRRICCSRLESCVSCCLHPEYAPYIKYHYGLLRGRDFPPLSNFYLNDEDTFLLCSVLCRTSSQSVLNENAYRHPDALHCFG